MSKKHPISPVFYNRFVTLIVFHLKQLILEHCFFFFIYIFEYVLYRYKLSDSMLKNNGPSVWSVSQKGQVRTRGINLWQENVVFLLFVRKWAWWQLPSGLLYRAELWDCTIRKEEITFIYELMSGLSFVPWETKQINCVLRERFPIWFWNTSIWWSLTIPMPCGWSFWFTALSRAPEKSW